MKSTLYAAAMELFQQKGFEATSIDDIAERAGFSRATFFNHFGAKQGVLRHYGQQLQARAEVITEQADPHTPPLETVREILNAFAREAEAHIGQVRIIYRHSGGESDFLTNLTPARRRVWEILTGLLAAAKQRGDVNSHLPAEQMALHVLSLYQGVILAIVVGLGTAQDLLHSMWTFAMHGVGHDAPSAE